MKERIVPNRSIQDIEKLINKMTSGKSIDIRNWQDARDFDAQNDDAQKLAYVLATLINDLKLRGIY